jgi:hypothetical protein
MKQLFSFKCAIDAAVVLLISTTGAAPAFAKTLLSSSYSINTATGIGSLTDQGGNQLTDGLFGTTDISSGTLEDPWVGWTNIGAGPNAIFLTFNFSNLENIASVNIDFLKETADFVFLPDGVLINGQSTSVNPNALADPGQGFLTFSSVGLTTQTVQIEIDRAGSGFNILIDEVTFNGTDAVAGAPEPATLGTIGAGLLGLMLIARRRAVSKA